jgi:hypothetical protein
MSILGFLRRQQQHAAAHAEVNVLDMIARGDVVSACVNGEERAVRVLYVNQHERTVTVTWKPAGALMTRTAEIDGSLVMDVIARERIERGAVVTSMVGGYEPVAVIETVWAVYGPLVEMKSGCVRDFGQIYEVHETAAMTAETEAVIA